MDLDDTELVKVAVELSLFDPTAVVEGGEFGIVQNLHLQLLIELLSMSI